MNKLPETANTIKTLDASEQALETLNNILERKQELEDMVAIIQPLLWAVSIKLYGEEDNSAVDLRKLVQEGCDMLGVKPQSLQ